MLVESFIVELDCLIQEPYFAIFNRTSNIEDLDFKVAFRTMQDVALIWHATLLQLLGNQRIYRVSYPAGDQKAIVQDALAKRVYAITSIICASRVKKRSNFFILLIDIYLIGSSVKRRVFKTLSGFRLCYGYYLANYIIGSIAEEAEVY